jgi:hypothetical protein
MSALFLPIVGLLEAFGALTEGTQPFVGIDSGSMPVGPGHSDRIGAYRFRSDKLILAWHLRLKNRKVAFQENGFTLTTCARAVIA